MKKGVRILIAAIGLTMTIINSQAEPVRAYERKDGTHVSSYDRNSSRPVVPTPAFPSSNAVPATAPTSSTDYDGVYSPREAQQHAGQVSDNNGQPPVVVTITERPPTKPSSTITSDEWVSDTLNVYGALSSSSVIEKVIGYDRNQQVVTESSDYTIESDGTFHARLSDAKKEIRFLKVILIDKITDVPTRHPTSAPVAAVQSETSSNGGVFIGLLIFGIIFVLLWLVVKSISSTVKAASTKPLPLPPPTSSESANQELVLADLAQGSPPHRYQLEGFLPKKGESVIWAFLGVKHYQKGTHSEWVGQSSGASVRLFKGFWVRSGASRGHKVSHSEMDYQGVGTLVLTTIGLCFIGASSTRIPLSHILAFQSYADGIGFDTDYARNNRHVFTQIHWGNVAFIATVLDTMKAA